MIYAVVFLTVLALPTVIHAVLDTIVFLVCLPTRLSTWKIKRDTRKIRKRIEGLG